MNLVCNTDLTTQGSLGQCECRRDMRWNTAEGECQFYLDVDCSSFTYETQPSPTILAAVERANTAIQARPASTTLDEALGEFGGNILDSQHMLRADCREHCLNVSLCALPRKIHVHGPCKQ